MDIGIGFEGSTKFRPLSEYPGPVQIGVAPALAQSLEILDAPSQPIEGIYDDGNRLTSHMYVKNTSGSDKTVGLFRRVIDTVQGSANQFCWSLQCYSYSKDTAGNLRTISANGGIDSTFAGYYEPRDNPGIEKIEYCFYVENDVADSACTVVRYDATTGVSIREQGGKGSPRLSVSPNPARDHIKVRFEQKEKGTVRLHSILGETVLEESVRGDEGTLELDISKLDHGLHFLTFERPNGRSVTKKVMIRN